MSRASIEQAIGNLMNADIVMCREDWDGLMTYHQNLSEGTVETVGINDFVKRQCKKGFTGTCIKKSDLDSIRERTQVKLNSGVFKEGYASFCKIVSLRNRWGVKASYMEITLENKQFLTTSYGSRTDTELPYLRRNFNPLMGAPEAAYLHVIIYDKEQLEKEGDADVQSDFEIVCINAEMSLDKSSPMTPATMLRNHMGTAFGGSGVELDRSKYLESVEFWNHHAMIGSS